MYPLVSIVVINWNRAKDCLKCLESLYDLDYPQKRKEIIVVDNNSDDNSLDLIKLNFPEVKIIALKENGGYSAAMNRGVKVSSGELICVMSSNLVVSEEYLISFAKAAVKNPQFSIFGAKLLYSDRPKVYEKAYGQIDEQTLELVNIGRNEKDTGQYDQIKEVEAPVFKGAMFRRSVFKQVGFMEERYFLYYEDNDFVIRCHKKGIKIMFVPGAKIWHKDKRSVDQKLQAYYLTRNGLLMKRKFKKMSLTTHLKNFRFLLSSFLISLTPSANAGQFKAIYLGITDFYLGRFGKREIDVK